MNVTKPPNRSKKADETPQYYQVYQVVQVAYSVRTALNGA
jgi:hypothetical protein